MAQKTGVMGKCIECGGEKIIASQGKCWKCYASWRKETGQDKKPVKRRKRRVHLGSLLQGGGKAAINSGIGKEIREINIAISGIIDRSKTLKESFMKVREELVDSRIALQELKKTVAGASEKERPHVIDEAREG